MRTHLFLGDERDLLRDFLLEDMEDFVETSSRETADLRLLSSEGTSGGRGEASSMLPVAVTAFLNAETVVFLEPVTVVLLESVTIVLLES